MKFEDIIHAFDFASFGRPFEHSAYISKRTGEIYYVSELGGSDELPDDFEDEPDGYISIPHKNAIDLGRNLVLAFAIEYLPDRLDKVERIFHSRGAYGRFKALLEETGQLDAWYEYENAKKRATLREWCIEQGLNIDG